ncbi:AlpA family phage regulatory protein [Paraburkholderia sp. Ac-20342]|uniref:helix-turn-helix transcriptional regulator n=1 Tax=Paraburkholderia sp. Ac-20342 TaxID=2703889 RepID=UPI00198193C5|nr:AlpA family phage regulatory protein [Paraburkholderia sp. Ac-20342]MBN3848693.1 AlpA family phage regulatory protein [Paraburkholderia sp. Ac-20342]
MKGVTKPVFYLDLPSVAEAVALSESVVKKLVREGVFPQPRQLSGRRVAWMVREVEAWVEARPVSQLLPPGVGGSQSSQDVPQAA